MTTLQGGAVFNLGVRSVVFERFGLPIGADVLFGTPNEPSGAPNVYKYGRFWFTYGGYNGAIEFVNFDNSIFFPKDHSCDGYGYILDKRINGQFHTIYNEMDTLPIGILGDFVDIARGVFGGLRQVGKTGLQDAVPVTKQIARRVWHGTPPPR